MKSTKQIKVFGMKEVKVKGGEIEMKNIIKLCAIGLIAVCANSAFAVGGVLPDGQGTNQNYGVLNGRGAIIRNFETSEINGTGITNIPSGGIVSLDAAKLTGAIGAIDLGSGTNVPGANITGTVPAARLGANLEKLAGNDAGSLTNVVDAGIVGMAASKLTGALGAIDAGAATNLNATELRSGTVADARLSSALQALAGNNGGALTNVTAAAPGDMLSTNATPQSKAGLLTLNGGATIAGELVLMPSNQQTLTNTAVIAANAANIKVIGDGVAVECTLAAGTTEGQVLTVRGMSDTFTVTLTDVVPTFRLGIKDVISFTYDGAAWVEAYRRDN